MASKASARISRKVTLPSPALQVFLKAVVDDDSTYLRFLEDTPGLLASHGLALASDVSGRLLSDFRFAVDRARTALKERKRKLSFEDVFQVPVLEIDGGRIRVKPRIAVSDTRVDVYYSEKSSSENRGTKTDFSSGMTPNKSTDRWQTKDFGGSSIFEHPPEERFDRTPLLSAKILAHIVKAVAAQKL